MKRKVLLSVISAVCVVLCAFALVGCGQKEMNVKGNTFVFKDISFTYTDNFPAEEKITAEELAGYKILFKDKLLKFTEDGKFEMQYYATLSGTYVQDDAKITLTVTQDGKTETLDATISGNDVTVKMWSEFELDDNSTATAYINIVYTKTTSTSGSEGGNGEDNSTPTPASTEVTEAQWKSAMTGTTNFTFVQTRAKDGQTSSMTYKRVGDILLQGSEPNIAIMTKDGNNYYMYYTEDGSAWTRRTITQEIYEDYGEFGLVLTFFENDFSSFTYADGKYTATNLDKSSQMGEIISTIEVTFSDGKIVAFSFELTNGASVTYTYVLSDFGTTTITVPTDYTEEPVTPETTSEVTEAQWKSAMTGTTNFTIDIAVTFSGQSQSATAKVFGDTLSQGDGTNEIIITKDGNNYYWYSTTNGGTAWERETLDQDEYEEMSAGMLLFSFFENDFSSFTYADGKYTATNLDKMATMNGIITSMEVGFSNGQIVSASFTTTSEVMTDVIMTGVYTFSDFGTTTITIPTTYTEAGSSNPTPATGSEVTEAQWTYALTGLANADYKVTLTETKDGSTTTIGVITYFGRTISVVSYVDEDGQSVNEEEIYTWEDGSSEGVIFYRYVKKADGSYTRQEIEEDEYLENVDTIGLGVFADLYVGFTYDDVSGKYVCTSDALESFGLSGVTASVGFLDGEVISFEMAVTYTKESETITKTVTVSDIGTATVTVPTEYTEEDGSEDDTPATGSKVNEAQWKSAMTGTNNYTYNKGHKETETCKVNKSENGFAVFEKSATDKDLAKIYTLEEGNYYFYYTYYYTYSNPTWIRSNESKYTTQHEQVNVLNVLKDAFSQFTYNADSGTYYCQRFQTTYENKLFSYSQVTVTFEDGEIVAFNCYLAYGGKEGDTSYEIVLSDIGTTETIIVPNMFMESSN